MEDLSDAFDAVVRVRATITQSDDPDAWGVVEAQVEDDAGDPVRMAGPGVGTLRRGERSRIVGVWTEHARYGRQVRVQVVEPVDPIGRAEQRAFLRKIKGCGLGPKRADRLIDLYGAGLLAAIDADPMGAFRSAGLRPEQAEQAAGQWAEQRGERAVRMLLVGHNLDRVASELIARYGAAEALRVVREDPYSLVDLRGVQFRTADEIARRVGVPHDAPQRGQAAIIHTLREAEQRDGHVMLPVEELLRRAHALTGGDPRARLAEVLARRRAIQVGDSVYRPITYEREARITRDVVDLSRRPCLMDAGSAPRTDGFIASPLQEVAIERAFRRGISILTGGPGTGKSATTAEIAHRAMRSGHEIALAAPTGRAAKRLSSLTGYDAFTVHRLLEWHPSKGPQRHHDNPIDAQLVIVDEGSMCDQEATAAVLAALRPDAHLLIVGDVCQLPPVGAGQPMADLIASGRVTTTVLTEVRRQAAGSAIVRAAHAINHGHIPHLGAIEGERPDLFFAERMTPADIAGLVCDFAAQRIPAGTGRDALRDVQVLCPTAKGAAGTKALNEELQKRLNPDGEPVSSGGVRVGDKVICTRNSYEFGLMNGEIVQVIANDSDDKTFVVFDEDTGRRVQMPYEQLRCFQLAYAVTIHRAQGCEMPACVLALDRASTFPGLMTRPMLYTGLTRARELAVIVGQGQAITECVARASTERRHSLLCERLQHALAPLPVEQPAFGVAA